MNKTKQSKAVLRKTLALVVAIMVIGGLTSTLYSDDPKSVAPPSGTASPSSPAGSSDATTQAPPAELTGAELYSMHCNRCHPERYPTERTSANWKTIMLHMQVRVNLPPSQARLILKYLQDNSGR